MPPQVDLPALEQEILGRWEADKVFARSLDASAGRPQWNFYEGPPTANGRPGTHHIEARAFKDVFPRFKTMQGWHVPRRAGWDCHGLPVEIAVEQELGFAGKPDIERYGIAEFNARCRESVERHVSDFSDLTRRMGYWVDLSTAYWTMDPAYIESVWWSLKQVFDKGLLVESRSAGLDDDAVDPAVEHRGRRPPGRHLRRRAKHQGPRPPRHPRRRRAAAGRRLR
jgi:isoleucyl-tRNA synthetase